MVTGENGAAGGFVPEVRVAPVPSDRLIRGRDTFAGYYAALRSRVSDRGKAKGRARV